MKARGSRWENVATLSFLPSTFIDHRGNQKFWGFAHRAVRLLAVNVVLVLVDIDKFFDIPTLLIWCKVILHVFEIQI